MEKSNKKCSSGVCVGTGTTEHLIDMDSGAECTLRQFAVIVIGKGVIVLNRKTHDLG